MRISTKHEIYNSLHNITYVSVGMGIVAYMLGYAFGVERVFKYIPTGLVLVPTMALLIFIAGYWDRLIWATTIEMIKESA